MTKRKILVIDDDKSILDAVSLVLEEEGYLVDKTPDCKQIDKKISQFDPDLILLDILLSGYDGREICKKLKTDQKTKHIPILMVSAHPSAQDGAVAAGADGFLAKPFNIEDLLKKVEQYVKK